MSATDWSREIAALNPFIQGTVVELKGPATGVLAGTAVTANTGPGNSPDWSPWSDASVDVIVALGAPDPFADPVGEIRQWRRVLREGGTLALIFARSQPPTWLSALLDHIGGFEVVNPREVRQGETWLFLAHRRAIAELRNPLGTLGPAIAARANEGPALRAELYFQVGTILLQAGDAELAAACFTSLQDIEGRSSDGLFGLGMCHGSQGRWAEALTSLQRALELSPGDEQITRWVALAQEKTRPAAQPAEPTAPEQPVAAGTGAFDATGLRI